MCDKNLEDFQNKFITTIDELWAYIHHHVPDKSYLNTRPVRPKSQGHGLSILLGGSFTLTPTLYRPFSDNQPYNDCQLKEIASGIRGKIRKINQREGKTPDKFLGLIDKIVERIKYVGSGLDWEEFEKDPILQQLRDMPCLSQQASQVTDNEITRQNS